MSKLRKFYLFQCRQATGRCLQSGCSCYLSLGEFVQRGAVTGHYLCTIVLVSKSFVLEKKQLQLDNTYDLIVRKYL